MTWVNLWSVFRPFALASELTDLKVLCIQIHFIFLVFILIRKHVLMEEHKNKRALSVYDINKKYFF